MKNKFVLSLLSLCLFASPALAVMSAEEYMVIKMTNDQRFGYMNGVLDMAIYQAAQEKNKLKAECISNWYYRDDTAPQEVVKFFTEYNELPAPAKVAILIKRHCGSL